MTGKVWPAEAGRLPILGLEAEEALTAEDAEGAEAEKKKQKRTDKKKQRGRGEEAD